MGLVLTNPPEAEPVSIADLRVWGLPDASESDNLLLSMALAARQWCEAYTQRVFITQTWTLYMDFFPGYIDMKLAGTKVSSPFVSGSNAVLVGIRYAVVLPFPPVQSIASFTYLDGNGNPQTMAAGADFIVDVKSNPARLTPPFGSMWPVARVVTNALAIQFVAGYGDTGAAVPECIKSAIKMLTVYWYRRRIPDDADVPFSVKALLAPYRDLRL